MEGRQLAEAIITVKARTYPDLDRELPSVEVQGRHTTRHVQTLGYTQHLVNGIPVDPRTIEFIEGV